MNRKKVIIGVLMAAIFVMVAFVPAANYVSSDRINAKQIHMSPEAKPISTNVNSVSNFNHRQGNTSISYSIHNNILYTNIYEQGKIPAKEQFQNITLTGNNIHDNIVIGKNSMDIIMETHLGGIKNRNQTSAYRMTTSSGRSYSFTINDPTYHKSFSWGQAWVSCSSITFHGSIGKGGFKYMVAAILLTAEGLSGAVYASTAFIASIVGILSGVVVIAWAAFVNDHPTTNGNFIPYVEMGFSEGKWWDPWDTGAYGELGAYSNQAFSITGEKTYSGGYGYWPFLTSIPVSNTMEWSESVVPHASVWPSLNPPW